METFDAIANGIIGFFSLLAMLAAIMAIVNVRKYMRKNNKNLGDLARELHDAYEEGVKNAD